VKTKVVMLCAGTVSVTTPAAFTLGRATEPRLFTALVSTACAGLTGTGIWTRVDVLGNPADEVFTTISVQVVPFEKASIRRLLGTFDTL
jgi:hypothetical protein